MVQSTIENLAAQTANVFLQNGYTHRSIHEKKVVMQKIILLHKQHGYDCYSPEIIAMFLKDVEHRYQRHEIGKIRFRFYQKTADYLTQFHEKGSIDLYSRNTPTNLTPYYEKIFTHIRDYESWGKSTKHSVRKFSMPYFKWLLQNGVTSLEQVTDEMIRKYLLDCSNRMTLNSVDTAKRVLKKLHRYLYEAGLCNNSFSDTLSFTIPTEHRIKKPVPQEEIAAVLSTIDRNTSIGKRDYAVIILATVTGMRSVDIINLQLTAIDWINGEIRIIQSKTEKALALPLTKDVGMAFQDYIMNGRPDSDLPFVFLHGRAPYGKMGHTLPYQIFNSYRLKIGLPKCTFHGLRRAVGTNMVIAGIPVTTVSQVLGHSRIDPTKQYISLDSVHLKECALDLDGFMPEGGSKA